MGSAQSCEKCPAASASTVFTFSQPLVLKLTEGIEPEPEHRQGGQPLVVQDREWIDRIHCIDDMHSNAYGLTRKSFDKIADHIEKSVTEENKALINDEEVKKCYRDHPGDTLKCADVVRDYVDRVDLDRLTKIRDKFSDIAVVTIELEE